MKAETSEAGETLAASWASLPAATAMKTPAATALATAELTAVDLDPPRDMLPTTPAVQPARVLESLATKLIPAMTPELVPYSHISTKATDMIEEKRSETYRARGVKNLDGEELGLLGYTVGLGSYGSGAVSAVAVAVGVGAIASVVGKEGSTALEFGMSGGNAGVNNVHTGVGSSSVVVGVRSATTGCVGDTSQTPGG